MAKKYTVDAVIFGHHARSAISGHRWACVHQHRHLDKDPVPAIARGTKRRVGGLPRSGAPQSRARSKEGADDSAEYPLHSRGDRSACRIGRCADLVDRESRWPDGHLGSQVVGAGPRQRSDGRTWSRGLPPLQPSCPMPTRVARPCQLARSTEARDREAAQASAAGLAVE